MFDRRNNASAEAARRGSQSLKKMFVGFLCVSDAKSGVNSAIMFVEVGRKSCFFAGWV